MTEKLSEELIAGGYNENTPAAIVYKASWPDEKVVHCTVATLAEAASANNISNLALITVGGFLGNEYDRSELYNHSFTHGFREASTAKEAVK